MEELLGLGESGLQIVSACCPEAGRWRVYCPDMKIQVDQPKRQAGQCWLPRQLWNEKKKKNQLLFICEFMTIQHGSTKNLWHILWFKVIYYSENDRIYLQGSLACISGLSRTLWGMGLGLGWTGMLAVQEAVGGLTVSTGFGTLDLTAVWAIRCTGGRGEGVVVTEHTTKRKKKTGNCHKKVQNIFLGWIHAFFLV